MSDRTAPYVTENDLKVKQELMRLCTNCYEHYNPETDQCDHCHINAIYSSDSPSSKCFLWDLPFLSSADYYVRWIPCSDHLPDADGEYLVTIVYQQQTPDGIIQVKYTAEAFFRTPEDSESGEFLEWGYCADDNDLCKKLFNTKVVAWADMPLFWNGIIENF